MPAPVTVTPGPIVTVPALTWIPSSPGFVMVTLLMVTVPVVPAGTVIPDPEVRFAPSIVMDAAALVGASFAPSPVRLKPL